MFYTVLLIDEISIQWFILQRSDAGMECDCEQEGPLRRSLFTNIPPYLNYLPNGRPMAEAGPCQQHTDTMVDLRCKNEVQLRKKRIIKDFWEEYSPSDIVSPGSVCGGCRWP